MSLPRAAAVVALQLVSLMHEGVRQAVFGKVGAIAQLMATKASREEVTAHFAPLQGKMADQVALITLRLKMDKAVAEGLKRWDEVEPVLAAVEAKYGPLEQDKEGMPVLSFSRTGYSRTSWCGWPTASTSRLSSATGTPSGVSASQSLRLDFLAKVAPAMLIKALGEARPLTHINCQLEHKIFNILLGLHRANGIKAFLESCTCQRPGFVGCKLWEAGIEAGPTEVQGSSHQLFELSAWPSG
ncbi:uncharacterized protein PSFLO_01399 [Pseudozyma flocculosa]|uniref:Uncharacterized protein n=1 Tax=Pseudozyma flocculosa TaxID=84751 RepID=A0A5C3EUD8_9BASI|nr:uncharacterized protein PSFLO_01399 [Pseudozyma flocculosa]